jgi:hypothetical protein
MGMKIVTLLSLLLSSEVTLAHGMNKHGPNGGYIKMPGAFHTELVDKNTNMHVYLLDMSFKNPTSVNSSVKIIYKGNSESEFFCTNSVNYIVCKKPTNGLKNIKEIIIKTIRANNKGRDAIYSLPLQLEGGLK